MNLIIRKTDKKEYLETEYITREAFWNLYKPGCDEHLALNQLRNSKSYIQELDMIALCEGDIVGHIITTKARVIDHKKKEYEVLCVGPVSVLPWFQNKGVGSKLLTASITEAKIMGFKGMILFGNPEYYHRFGFRNAKEYEITTKENQNFDPFMALELQENGLTDIKGRFFENEAFFTKEVDLIEFENKFPSKEKGKPKVNISIK